MHTKSKELSTIYLIALFITVSIWKIFQYIDVISFIFIVITSVFLFISNQFYKKITLLAILLMFSQYENGLNFATIGKLPLKAYLLITFIMVIYELYKNKFKIENKLFIFVLSFILFACYSIIVNFFDFQFYYYALDVLPILCVLLFWILFRNIAREQIIKILYLCLIAYTAFISIVCIFKIGVVEDPIFPGFYTGNRDEAFAFFLPLSFILIFCKNSFSGKIISFIIFLINFILPIFLFGIGSQILILLPLTLFFFMLNYNKGRFVIILLLITIFSFYSGFSGDETEDGKNNLLVHKIHNVTALANMLGNSGEIYKLPRSPQVRVIELVNIVHRPLLYNFIGSGFGSYFNDKYFHFLPNINKDDYDLDSIKNHKFYTPHNIGYTFLKYGLLFYLLMAWLYFKILCSKFEAEVKAVCCCLFTFVLFNFGWTYKVSLCLVILIIILARDKNHSVII